jgi:hypothetical protein
MHQIGWLLVGLEAGTGFHSRSFGVEELEEVVIEVEGPWKHVEGQDDGAEEVRWQEGRRNSISASSRSSVCGDV